MKKALLYLNGDLESGLPLVQPDEYDLRVAVDGAINLLVERGLFPHAVVGDLDSATPKALAAAEKQGCSIQRVPDQDSTDFEKALHYVDEAGIHRVDVIGHRGKRLDHELAILEAAGMHAAIMTIRFLDAIAEGFVLNGLAEKSIQHRKGHLCSILPIIPCEGVSLSGFRWTLHNERLGGGFPISCSNEIVRERASVSLRNGALLIYLHHEKR